MRISFVTHGLGDGGTERMIQRLSEAFVKRGYEVDILAINANDSTYVVDDRVKIRYIGGDSQYKVGRIVHSVKELRKHIKSHKIDIIACFIVTTIPVAVVARIGIGNRPLIIGAERMNPKMIKRTHRWLVRLFLNGCEGFIFQTQGAKSQYPKKIQERSVVISNIAPDYNSNIDEKNHIKHGVCASERLHPEKDISTIIKAFRRIIQEIPDTTLHIYGIGSEEGRLKELTRQLELEKKIFFEGFKDDMETELQKYDVFVFSSKAEGMPNSLIEAMAAGLACVSTDCEYGPSELIRDGVNGFLVPVGDEKAIAKRVIQLLKNDIFRINMGMEASKIKEILSEMIIIDQYILYFQKNLEANGRI